MPLALKWWVLALHAVVPGGKDPQQVAPAIPIANQFYHPQFHVNSLTTMGVSLKIETSSAPRASS